MTTPISHLSKLYACSDAAAAYYAADEHMKAMGEFADIVRKHYP